MFAVTVTFEVAPGRMADLMPPLLENARASREEPGCRRFDVLTDPARPDTIFLYELYDDAAGFEAHMNYPHFKTFAAIVEPMIKSRELLTWESVSE
jgi:autoinducer 2-degrading protein